MIAVAGLKLLNNCYNELDSYTFQDYLIRGKIPSLNQIANMFLEHPEYNLDQIQLTNSGLISEIVALGVLYQGTLYTDVAG